MSLSRILADIPSDRRRVWKKANCNNIHRWGEPVNRTFNVLPRHILINLLQVLVVTFCHCLCDNVSVLNFVYDNPYMGTVGVEGIKLFALFDHVVDRDLNVVGNRS